MGFFTKVWEISWEPQRKTWYFQQLTMPGSAPSPRLKRKKEESTERGELCGKGWLAEDVGFSQETHPSKRDPTTRELENKYGNLTLALSYNFLIPVGKTETEARKKE